MQAIKYSNVPFFTLKLVRGRNIRYPVAKVADASQVETVLRAYLQDQDCEHLVVVMLDGQNNLVGVSEVSVGGMTGVHVALRDIFKHAIAGRAHALVLGHNHGSSDVTPSQEDIVLTEKAKEAGELLGIPVVDHVIISSGVKEGSYSFLAHGLVFS